HLCLFSHYARTASRLVPVGRWKSGSPEARSPMTELRPKPRDSHFHNWARSRCPSSSYARMPPGQGGYLLHSLVWLSRCSATSDWICGHRFERKSSFLNISTGTAESTLNPYS